jgi:hypothetical protein
MQVHKTEPTVSRPGQLCQRRRPLKFEGLT